MLHIVTGGSGSGKSAYAENEILRLAKQGNCKKYYIATMEPFGEETLRKIARHREMRRDKGFETIECYVGLQQTAGRLEAHSAVLLECISNLTANEIYRPDGAGIRTADAVTCGVEALCGQCAHVVIVTNEVCSECGRDSEDMIRYKKTLAEINRRLAAKADAVTEVVYGIPVKIKRIGKTQAEVRQISETQVEVKQ